VNAHTQTREFSLRDPDGYYVTVSELSSPGDLRLTVQVGDRVIPETGETAEVGLPRGVYRTVDPGHKGGVPGVATAQLRATLFHEWYHLVREAHFAPAFLADRWAQVGTTR